MTTTQHELYEDLVSRGYKEIDETSSGIRAGDRIRNRSHQWPEAAKDGTATALAVLRNEGSTWEQTYDAPDVEILVERDNGTFTQWASYGTFFVSRTDS